MDRQDLESLRQFVNKALSHGWHPCDATIEGTYVIVDPTCVRIAVASSSQLVDNDIFVDWLAPLHDISLAKAVWGERLIANGNDYLPAWRFHQHKLLDLLQTTGIKAYAEYMEITSND